MLKAGSLCIQTDDPAAYLRQVLADYKSPQLPGLPTFTGGLVGYFSYDYLGYSEPSVRSQAADSENFKDVDLMLFDKVIAFDNLRQKIILIANMSLAEPEVNYSKAVLELKQLAQLLRTGEKRAEPRGRLTGPVTPLFDQARYCAMVEQDKYHIREGDIFQVVLSNRLSAPYEGGLLNAYRVLRTVNPFTVYVLSVRHRRGGGRCFPRNSGQAGKRRASHLSSGRHPPPWPPCGPWPPPGPTWWSWASPSPTPPPKGR